jgi:hypothetical protein
MEKYLKGLLVFMRNLELKSLWTEMSMDESRVDFWDEDFQGRTENGDWRNVNIPKQFIKLVDTLVEKYSEEIWDGSQNEWGSGFYRVNVTINLDEKNIVITSNIEEQTSEGSESEHDVENEPSVQSFLSDNNIGYFEIAYSGGADDGFIEDDGYDDNGNKYRISDDLENYLTSILNSDFGGWEINEGSSGKFILTKYILTIEHEWYENIWGESNLRIVITEKDLD